MNFKFVEDGNQYWYEFEFDTKGFIGIYCYPFDRPGNYSFSGRPIDGGGIIWSPHGFDDEDGFLHLTKGAKAYMNRFAKLKAFI